LTSKIHVLKVEATVMDEVDKNFIGDLLMILIILLVVIGSFAFLHTSSVLLGGGLALAVVAVAEYVWSRGSSRPTH